MHMINITVANEDGCEYVPSHSTRRRCGDDATTLRRAQLPNEPTSRRADDAVAHCVLSNAVPSNAAPSNERRAVERADHCAVPAGGCVAHVVQSNAAPSNGNAAPEVSHTVCRRTLRRRTCGTLRHPQGVVGERVEVGAVDEVLVVEATLLSGGGVDEVLSGGGYTVSAVW